MVSAFRVISVSLPLLFLTVSANPAPVPFDAPFAVAGDLVKRAAAPQFDLSQIPGQCQDACKDANSKISGCTSDSCFCTNPNLAAFGACLSCVVADPDSKALLDKNTAQSSMDVVTGVCNKEGFKVKDVTIGAPSSATRYVITGLGVWAEIAVGVFALV